MGSFSNPIWLANLVAHDVYITGAHAVRRADELRTMGIVRVLKLYEDAPFWPEDFIVCDNALNDGEFVPFEKLRRGVDFVMEHNKTERPVLIQCGAGISRSSTFVLAFLLERGYDLHDAWKLLKRQHDRAMPHPEMWRSLLTHYKLPYTFDDVWKWLI
jgi:protein-tyrosine phosphatase